MKGRISILFLQFLLVLSIASSERVYRQSPNPIRATGPRGVRHNTEIKDTSWDAPGQDMEVRSRPAGQGFGFGGQGFQGFGSGWPAGNLGRQATRGPGNSVPTTGMTEPRNQAPAQQRLQAALAGQRTGRVRRPPGAVQRQREAVAEQPGRQGPARRLGPTRRPGGRQTVRRPGAVQEAAPEQPGRPSPVRRVGPAGRPGGTETRRGSDPTLIQRRPDLTRIQPRELEQEGVQVRRQKAYDIIADDLEAWLNETRQWDPSGTVRSVNKHRGQFPSQPEPPSPHMVEPFGVGHQKLQQPEQWSEHVPHEVQPAQHRPTMPEQTAEPAQHQIPAVEDRRLEDEYLSESGPEPERQWPFPHMPVRHHPQQAQRP